eukprot:1667-Eustigmatos_ZCMA.PRE.1
MVRGPDGSGAIGLKPYLSANALLGGDNTYWWPTDSSNRRILTFDTVVSVSAGDYFDMQLNAGSSQSIQWIRANA